MATILALMLLVTFIANYLTTTLPQTMSVNDINHDLVVQNEVGRFAALLSQAASNGAVGAELTQPFVLGSVGQPPFAQQDGSSIAPVITGSKETVGFALAGATGASIFQVSTGAAFFVQLHNTYAPIAEVAFDYGGVIFTQQSGIPAMIDPPPITVTGTGSAKAATIWMPVFTSALATEGGIGTAILTVRLTSVTTQSFPAGGLTLTSAGVTVTVTTPFSAAWMAYLHSNSAFAGDATCTPAASSVCSTSGTFSLYGPLGTVKISLPVASVTLEVATFSISLS